MSLRAPSVVITFLNWKHVCLYSVSCQLKILSDLAFVAFSCIELLDDFVLWKENRGTTIAKHNHCYCVEYMWYISIFSPPFPLWWRHIPNRIADAVLMYPVYATMGPLHFFTIIMAFWPYHHILYLLFNFIELADGYKRLGLVHWYSAKCFSNMNWIWRKNDLCLQKFCKFLHQYCFIWYVLIFCIKCSLGLTYY